jgi:hypothetical protein
MVGLVAVADGGRLSETAFNTWTVASQMFKEAGCPTSQRIDFNLSEYARRLWGQHSKSGTLRRRIADALGELLRTRVVVMGIDPYDLEPAEGATWELNLLEGAGVRSHLKDVFAAARRGDRAAVAELASLSYRAADEKATWSMVLPKWLADSIRRDQGVILDYEVQRALRGSAKRIWVQLESNTSWRTRRIPRPETDAQLREEARKLTDWGAPPTVEPAADEDAVEVQTMVLPLSSEVYEALGLTHGNRKRDLDAACESILATDRTYLRAEARPQPGSKRRFDLHLVRAAGAFRQERHREALRLRTEDTRRGGSKPKEAASGS